MATRPSSGRVLSSGQVSGSPLHAFAVEIQKHTTEMTGMMKGYPVQTVHTRAKVAPRDPMQFLPQIKERMRM
eukprot:2020358-Rhodomonas_salina.1